MVPVPGVGKGVGVGVEVASPFVALQVAYDSVPRQLHPHEVPPSYVPTHVAVPTKQRLAVGAVGKVPLLAEPQTPVLYCSEVTSSDPLFALHDDVELDPVHVHVQGPVPETALATVPLRQSN